MNKGERTKKLKQFLGSECDEIRALGIIMAISQGYTPSQLAQKCMNEGWYYNHSYNYNVIGFVNKTVFITYSLGDYNIYKSHKSLIFRKDINILDHWRISKKTMKYHRRKMFALMIERFLDDRNIKYNTWPQKMNLS